MGGFGSGEYERNFTKVLTHECLSLDSFAIARFSQGDLATGITYKRQLSGGKVLTAAVAERDKRWVLWSGVIDQAVSHPELWTGLLGAIKHAGDSPEIIAAKQDWLQGKPHHFPFAKVFAPQLASFTVTASSAGARCIWFSCPVFREGTLCSRRCRKLYWKDGEFACRQCHNLAYQSQRRTTVDRLLERAENIRWKVLNRLSDGERAEWQGENLVFPPPAPDMRFAEYESMEQEWQSCRKKACDLIVEKSKKQADKLLDSMGMEINDYSDVIL